MSASGWVHFEVEIVVHETPAAFLLRFEEWEGDTWVPKSVIDSSEVYENGDENCTISIQEWWAEKEGMA
jgi:hypothetical protein